MDKEPTQRQIKEPRPPHCVCCEYMRVCDKDRTNGQKIDYCPDESYRRWLIGEIQEYEEILDNIC